MADVRYERKIYKTCFYNLIMSIVEYKEFKGNKVLSIKRDENDNFPFSFGKTKAKLILENLEEIKKFVEESEKESESKEKSKK